MYKERRVLVVEDVPDVRVTISGLLSDEGYYVRSVSSRGEALSLLETERFHVAVLDVRLDETDEGNQEGMLLMHEIKEKDPTSVIIILTGFATVKMVQEALQPDETGSALAFSFLEKSEMLQLPEHVRGAFENAVRFNPALDVRGLEAFLASLPKKLRFNTIPAPPPDQLADEADELLRKLFCRCEGIHVQDVRGGYSDAAVFQVVPWYPARGQGEALIAKIGEPAIIDQEINNYKNHVQGVVGGHRLPKDLDYARTRSMAGIVYSFAGLGEVKDFAAFYQQAELSEIVPVIENLFYETCFPKRADAGAVAKDTDLRELYMQLLYLYEPVLRASLEKTMGGRHPFHKDGEQTIWLADTVPLVNPVTFALSSDLRADVYMTILHGDLNGYNVLIDRHRETWLIDFAKTCRGPLLQDYATFETFLRLSLVTSKDRHLLYDWAQVSFGAGSLCDIVLPSPLQHNPQIQKAHQAILTVRKLALQNRMGDAEKTYLVGLLFNALKIMTIMNLPPAERDHALIAASLIAQRLQQMEPAKGLTMKSLTSDMLTEITDLLSPILREREARRTRLAQALGPDNPLLGMFVYEGPTDVFVAHVVQRLIEYGELDNNKQALYQLLEAVRDKAWVGADKQRRINEILNTLSSPAVSVSQQMAEDKEICRILVVEDEADVLSTLKGILEDEGYAVYAASNESEAFKAIRKVYFDMAVVDVRLHGQGPEDQSGLSLAITLRTLNQNICVVLVTGHGDVNSTVLAEAMLSQAVVGYIEKEGPDWHERILQAVAEICA